MLNDFDKLNRIFGVNGAGQEPPQGADAPLTDAVMPKRAPLDKILDFV